jgi:hypothetical protein
MFKKGVKKIQFEKIIIIAILIKHTSYLGFKKIKYSLVFSSLVPFFFKYVQIPKLNFTLNVEKLKAFNPMQFGLPTMTLLSDNSSRNFNHWPAVNLQMQTIDPARFNFTNASMDAQNNTPAAIWYAKTNHQNQPVSQFNKISNSKIFLNLVLSRLTSSQNFTKEKTRQRQSRVPSAPTFTLTHESCRAARRSVLSA